MQTLRQAASIAPPEPVEKVVPKLGFFHHFKTMLADSDDISALSSKRVIALLAFLCCMVGFFVDLFTDFQITQTIFDSMMWIVISGLGFTGLEKFAGKWQVTTKSENIG